MTGRGAHKPLFGAGQRVRIARASHLMTKDVVKSLVGSDFEIIRALPNEGAGYQYRVKNIDTGQERVAGETDLIAV